MAYYFYELDIKSKQSPSLQASGLTVASATQQFPLGARIYDETTGTYYKYVKASAATIAANDLCSYVDATGTVVASSPATAAGVGAAAGVNSGAGATAGVQIAASAYFWMAVEGPALVKATSTGYVLGDRVAPDVGAAGKVIEIAVATPTNAEVIQAAAGIGFALQAESGGTVKVYLNRLQ